MMTSIKSLLNYGFGRQKGQGVIEYAGAMIVAALIVAAVLTIGQAGMGNVYNSIFGGVQNFFNTQSSAL